MVSESGEISACLPSEVFELNVWNCISLEKRLDEPNLGAKHKFDHCFAQLMVFCFGPERSVLLRHAQV